jgi:mannosyltransferase OCH1-like enzyme
MENTAPSEWVAGLTFQQALEFLRENFNKKFLNERCVEKNEEYRIPKIIHIIWLGSSFPEKYKAWFSSWKNHHPDWNVILWTDEMVKHMPMINRDLFDKGRNYGEKSDILRVELIYRYGGLYVDTDYECFKPFDEFHKCCDFYAGMTQLDIYSINWGGVLINNALMAAIPGHPLMKHIIENLRRFKDMPNTGERTGPNLFMRSCFEYLLQAKENLVSVVFPPTYFYPISNIAIQAAGKGYSPDCIKPETYATHHCEASWAK